MAEPFPDLLPGVAATPQQPLWDAEAICPRVDQVTVPYLLGTTAPGAEGDEANALGDVMSRIASSKPAPNVELPPFDKGDKTLWLVKRALGGQDVAPRVLASLPAADQAMPFSIGIAVGMFEGGRDCLTDRIKQLAAGATDLLQFYSLVYDVVLWRDLAAAWLDPAGPGVHDAMDEVRSLHPGIYEMLSSYVPLVDRLNTLIHALNDTAPASEVTPLTVAQREASDWLSVLSESLAVIVRPVLEQIVSARGEPVEQGRIIGRVVGRVLAEAILLALDLYGLVSRGAGLVADLFEGTRALLADQQIMAVGARAEKLAPGITAAGQRLATAAEREAIAIYESTADVIEPYKLNTRKTYAFNERIRTIYGLTTRDVEYIELRLDSNHIVEDRWFDPFKAEFKRIFGINSAEEMDAMALHTTSHIRSGERMAQDLGLLGAEDEASLTKQMQASLKRAQIDPQTGAAKPFTNLDQVCKAHAEFYKDFYGEESRTWKERLGPWFAQALKKIKDAG